ALHRYVSSGRAVGQSKSTKRWRQPRHDQRVHGSLGTRQGPDRKCALPELIARSSIERPQDVIQRDEIHSTLVDDGDADHVPTGAPSPEYFAAVAADAVEELVARSHVQPVVERADFIRCAPETAAPDDLTGFDPQRHDPTIVGRYVDAIGCKRRPGMR